VPTELTEVALVVHSAGVVSEAALSPLTKPL
jgi:hypothetical protein